VIQAAIRGSWPGGQVFFVHNRVRTWDLGRQVQEMVPEARWPWPRPDGGAGVGKGHAALQPGEVDVLMCTAIIEAGLDIPRPTHHYQPGHTLGLSNFISSGAGWAQPGPGLRLSAGPRGGGLSTDARNA